MDKKKIFAVVPCAALVISMISSSGVINNFSVEGQSLSAKQKSSISEEKLADIMNTGTDGSVYKQRFLDLYNDIKNPDNGYFSAEGVPYHCIETLMCEAPDQGHESTSEAASYYVWLEAMKGKFSGNFDGLENAWDIINKYYIPTKENQPGQTDYNPDSPATYAAEYPLPTYYPSELHFGLPVGSDPLYKELCNTYNNSYVYGMHWLIDCDNFYKYGTRGDGISKPSYINTFQRGEEESTWETIPHPSWEEFKWGGSNGFLDLFTGDKAYSKQWRYTNAPDADARTVQAMYYAKQWADEDNVNIDPLVNNASKMGDYLRYSLFDKYFMKIGAQGTTPGSNRSNEHGLISWYYSWGGATPDTGNWSWRIGCSHNHGGYQNPLAAYILSSKKDFIPKSPTAKDDWKFSLDRQIEFYQWLQSAEGAIGGGCTNSYNGSYDKYPSDVSTFYGMAYQQNPVYHDPGSNTWFGMQAWTMQRMAQYYYETGDTKVKDLLDKWVKWAVSSVKLNNDGTFEIPNKLSWKGQPETWNGTAQENNNLHVTIENYGTDLGVAGSLSNALVQYAAAVKKYSPQEDYTAALDTAKQILDRIWNNCKDDKGVAVTEEREDYKRFFEKNVYLPHAITLGDGTVVTPDENGYVSFIDLRPQYRNDPMFKEVEAAYKEGRPAKFTYHRFWAQCDVALALGYMSILFPDGSEGGGEEETDITCDISTPDDKDTFDFTKTVTPITIEADASTSKGSIDKVDFFADGKLIGTAGSAPYSIKFTPDNKGIDKNGIKQIILTAKAYTDKDESKSSDAVRITVKFKHSGTTEIAPEVSITSPLDNTKKDLSKKIKPIYISADASVSKGKIKRVEFYVDGNLIKSDKTAPYKISWTPDSENVPASGEKKFVITAKAITDKNVSTTSEPVNITVKFNKSTQPAPTPVVNISEPDNGVTIDARNGTQTIKISATATVATGKIKSTKLYVNDTLIGESNGSSCTASYKTPDGYGPKPDGKVYVKFKAVAVSDKDKTASDEITVCIIKPLENTPPPPPPVERNLDLSVRHDSGAQASSISNTITLTNKGDTSYNLSKMKIKYYFTDNGHTDLECVCDNAGLQLSNSPWYINATSSTKMNIVSVPGNVTGADSCIEITFSNVGTPMNKNAQLILGTRTHTGNWAQFDQSDDYSYSSNKNIVVEYNGTVIWGNDINN